MGLRGSTLALVLACAGIAYGCGDDDSPPPSGSGGSSGNGGSAGRAGNAGKGGSGGSSGRAGTSGGARGGTGGHDVGGGFAGAGEAGNHSGGTFGGAGAGAGGMCEVQDKKPLGDCPLNPYTVTTTCSFGASCEAARCGEAWSAFDASGCLRAKCSSSATCGDDERCVAPILGEPTDCQGSIQEGCTVDSTTCECSCSWTQDCAHFGLCEPAALHPPGEDCPTAGKSCDELLVWQEQLGDFAASHPTGDLADAIDACTDKMNSALRENDCPGAGGGGAGGGGAGGQSSGGHGGA